VWSADLPQLLNIIGGTNVLGLTPARRATGHARRPETRITATPAATKATLPSSLKSSPASEVNTRSGPSTCSEMWLNVLRSGRARPEHKRPNDISMHAGGRPPAIAWVRSGRMRPAGASVTADAAPSHAEVACS